MELAREATISPEPDMSPESRKRQRKLHKDNKDKSGNGGFRKLFGRKNRTSKLPDDAATQLNAMGVKDDEPVSVAPAPEPPAHVHELVAAPAKPAFAREETTYATPPERLDPMDNQSTHSFVPSYAPSVTAPVPEPVYAPSEKTISRVNTADAREATTEFSRFDQGPLSEQPAFIPDESSEEEDDAMPPPIARKPSRSPVGAPQQAYQPPVRPAAESPPAQARTPPAAVMQDRWAQIRKNAAERAALREGQAGPTKPSDADEDTSGEESMYSQPRPRLSLSANLVHSHRVPRCSHQGQGRRVDEQHGWPRRSRERYATPHPSLVATDPY